MDQVGRALAVVVAAIASASLGSLAESSVRGGFSPVHETHLGDEEGASKQAPAATAQTAPTSAPGPRKAIAGIRGFESVSTLVFAARPNSPHTLRATYVFPDRVRWWIGVGEDKTLERQMRYRFGTEFRAIDPKAAKSHVLEGDARGETMAQMEMRRALMLWPAGFEWKSEKDASSVSLGALGRLVTVNDNARPTKLTWFDAQDRIVDEFRAIEWRVEAKKSWPTKFELWHEGNLVWRETIEAVDVDTRFIDSYFVPADRREGAGGQALEIGRVTSMDLPEHRRRRVPLELGTTWDGAREKYATLCAELRPTLAAQGIALDDKATFEVNAELAPTAVLLRLAASSKALGSEFDKDWPVWHERPGLVTFVIGLADAKASRLKALRDALPADASGGVPYMRFDPAKPGEHVLIVLPLEARDG